MSTRLKDVKIKCISILTDDRQPANGEGVILKEDGKSIEIDAVIHKFEPEGFLIIRPMLSKSVDSDDEYYEDSDIIEASYNAIKDIQKNGGTLFDTNHDFDILKEVYFVETNIIKEDDKSIWEMKVDIRDNEELMQKAKDGLINGVSIAGNAKKVKVKKFQDLIEKYQNSRFLKDVDASTILKDFNSEMDNIKNNDIYLVLDVLWTAVWNEWYKRDLDDATTFKKEFKTILQQAIKHVGTMSFEYVKKEGEKIKKGDGMEEKQVVEIVEKTIGLGKDETLKDVIAKAVTDAVGKIEPPKPTVIKSKDAEGKEVETNIVDVVLGLAKSVDKLSKNETIAQSDLEAKIKKQEEELVELKKGLTNIEELGDEGSEDLKALQKARNEEEDARNGGA